MSQHKVNYIEFPVSDIEKSKIFFAQVFGWVYVDHGKDYCSFSGPGTDGGFYLSANIVSPAQGSARIVFHTHELDKTIQEIQNAGGEIVSQKIKFPGGIRIHFKDINGNEFGVWSENSE